MRPADQGGQQGNVSKRNNDGTAALVFKCFKFRRNIAKAVQDELIEQKTLEK